MNAPALPAIPWTPAQVAEMYGVSDETIYREIRSGRLRAKHKRGQSRKWFITDDALREWAETMLED